MGAGTIGVQVWTGLISAMERVTCWCMLSRAIGCVFDERLRQKVYPQLLRIGHMLV